MDFIQPELEDPTPHHLDGELCNCPRCGPGELVQPKSEAPQSLDEFARQRSDLEWKKNMTHSSINKQIPPEILSAIFSYCQPTHMELDYRFLHHYEANSRPLEFGHVCRHWREVAWSTPGLWRLLFLVLRSSQLEERAAVLADLAREWLDRSGALPLTLYIRMDPNDSYYEEQHPSGYRDHPLLEVIKKYSQRWQDLYLIMWPPCIIQMGLNITTIPLLRTFKHWPIGPEDTGAWWNITMTPQHLDLIGLHASSPETVSRFFRNIDWNRINEVIIDSLPWSRYIQILKSASRMTRFTIDENSGFPLGYGEESLQVNDLVHCNLQFFKIAGQPTSLLDNFLSGLTFPSLTELDYQVGSFNRPHDISHCHFSSAFLDRITDLEDLSIELSLSLESERYINILRRWPSLKHLFLIDRDTFRRRDSSHTPSGRDFSRQWLPACPLLSLLAATHMNGTTGSTNAFLPALQTLGYHATYDDPPWYDLLRTLGPLSEFSNPRRRPLRALTIEFGYSVEKLDFTLSLQIREAKRAGVDITLIDKSIITGTRFY